MPAKSNTELAILAQLRKLRTDARSRAKAMSSQDQRRHAASLTNLAEAIEAVISKHTNPGRRYSDHATAGDQIIAIALPVQETSAAA